MKNVLKCFKNVLKVNKKIMINLIMIVLVVILTLNVIELIEVTESKKLQENNVKKQVEQYERQKFLQSAEKTINKTKQEENTTSSKKAIKTNAIEEILKNRERTINNVKQQENVTSVKTEKETNSVEQKENTASIKEEENITSTKNTTETNTVKEAIENENKDQIVKQEEDTNSTKNTVEANVIEEINENENNEKTSVGYSTAVTPETMTIMGYEEIDTDKAITFIVGLIGEDNVDKIKLNGTSLNFHISNTNKAAKAENVNAYFVLAQQLLETGIFTFENSSVKPEYYNFAGLGATDKDPKPNKFFSNYEGQLAQVQHLKGYATTDALNEECKDQRFTLLANKRGTAVNAAELSNKWASNVDYGKLLVDIYNRFHNVEVSSEIVSKYKYREF